MEIKLVLDKETKDMIHTIASFLLAGINSQNTGQAPVNASTMPENTNMGQQYTLNMTDHQGAAQAVAQSNPANYQHMPVGQQIPVNYQQLPPQQAPAAPQSAIPQQAPINYQQQIPQQAPAAPQSAIPGQSPVNYQQPMQQPGQQSMPPYQQPIPTSAPVQSYTLEQLQVAAGGLSMQGKTPVLYSIMSQFGVQAMTELPKERYGDFAVALRGAGAQI
jgi:hypothetical protein